MNLEYGQPVDEIERRTKNHGGGTLLDLILIGARFPETQMRVRQELRSGGIGDEGGKLRQVTRVHFELTHVHVAGLKSQLHRVGRADHPIEIDRGAIVVHSRPRSHARRYRGREIAVGTISGGNARGGPIIQLERSNGGFLRKILRAAGDGHCILVVVQGIVCDDIDDTVNGIEAKKRAAGPLHDFDLADGCELDRQRAPRREAVVVSVDLPAIDQNQQALRIGLVVAPHADVRIVGAPLQQIDVDNVAQHSGNVARSGAANVLRGNDLHIGRHFAGALWRTRRAGGNRLCE